MSSDATREVRAARRTGRHPITLVLPLVPLVAIAAVWYFSGLRHLDAARLADAARELRESPAAFVYVLVAFLAGTLLFVPVTALITATVLAFDPVRGFLFAYTGVVLGSFVTYWAGRLMGGRALDYVSGPRMLRFGELMRRHAIRASIAARVLPVGSFTGLNLFAGSLRIPFGSYVIGNLIGALPGVLFLTLFAEQLGQVLRAPSRENLSYLAIAVTLMAIVGFFLKRRVRRRAKAADGGIV